MLELKITVLFCCIFFSCVFGQATYCGDNIVPGAVKVNCFGVAGCLNQTCINQTCVTISLCPSGQICNMLRGTCQPANKREEMAEGNKIVSPFKIKSNAKKTTAKQKTPSKKTVTPSTNILVNGDFEDGLTGWRVTAPPRCDVFIADSTFYIPPSHENQVVFFNDDACLAEISQEFEIPYTDSITHFDLSFFLAYYNYAGVWTSGFSNSPTESLAYLAQEFYVQITDLGNNHILEEILRPDPDTIAYSEYALYNFSFESKRFSYDIPNFPRKLKLSFKQLGFQSYLTMGLDDVRLYARRVDGTAKKTDLESDPVLTNTLDNKR